MASPTYFPVGYFGGAVSDEGTVSTLGSSAYGGARFVDLYTAALDYELGTSDSAVLFTTARRKACINDGVQEFADLTNCWVRESTVTCSNGVGTYDLHSTVNVPSADFVRVTADGPTYRYTDVSSNVTYRSGDELPRRDVPWLNAQEPGWRASTGATYPTAWYLEAQGGRLQLGLYPPPTVASSAAGAVVLSYVARPSSLADDTSMPFTDTNGRVRADLVPYYPAFVHYAAHKLELLRKDREASDRQMQQFLGYVQRFIQQGRKPGGQSIRTARNYFSSSRDRRGGDELTGLRAPWWR